MGWFCEVGASCICPKLKEFCTLAQEWMDEENETESLRDWYVPFKKLEYLLYDLGIGNI